MCTPSGYGFVGSNQVQPTLEPTPQGTAQQRIYGTVSVTQVDEVLQVTAIHDVVRVDVENSIAVHGNVLRPVYVQNTPVDPLWVVPG